MDFSFKNYLCCLESSTNFDIFGKNELYESALGSNAKGVLHEILVGKHLNGGKHMSPEAEANHDKLTAGLSSDEYDHENHRAKVAADAIKAHAKSLGKTIHSVHWTSKPGDIKRVTGHDESQHDNPSDIMIKHKDGSHTGYSLKVTDKKHGHIPVGNPGHGETDRQLGIDTSHHYEHARSELTRIHPELHGKPKSEQKKIIKENPKMKATAHKLSTEAIGKIRDSWHDKLSSMSTENLAHHIRHNLLHAKETKTPMYKLTTGGTNGDHSTEIEHPLTHHDHILNDHKNITVKKSGNNSIEFLHKGKRFLRHRIKPESTPVVTALKGSAE